MELDEGVTSESSTTNPKQDKTRQDKARTKPQTEPKPTKPRAGPRYTDKSRKNKKNKPGQENKTEVVTEDTIQGTEEQLNGHPTQQVGSGGENLAQSGGENLAQSGGENLAQSEGESLDQQVVSGLEMLSVHSDPDEDSWDTLFNDDGDCLDSHLEKELAVKEGRKKKKSIQEARVNNDDMEPDHGLDDDIDMTDMELSHIVEVYEFPQEFKTEDLLKLFQSYQQRKVDIQWVDESHALALFFSPAAARDALTSKQPLLKMRPLSKSTAATKAKARSCSDYLLPTRERPQTSAALARRLVIGALGVKNPQSQEERDAEKKKLQDAREQKRMAAKQREDAWEGH
ncbi:hypothetical protein NHX12_018384 [Muraenolepis orangiensis]|uniref:Coiled-coil domain-containing protein R3HCC1L n=1 Tax=Muraenolepis orangiensis TaxID=630683 RepID=A0A9Q0IXH8_9TELE|nr:hypothetical protein NHX12_018384 [Muraenolepis orangiensis]